MARQFLAILYPYPRRVRALWVILEGRFETESPNHRAWGELSGFCVVRPAAAGFVLPGGLADGAGGHAFRLGSGKAH